jgi:DNA-directed RNA polymerase specialized sigma24 family protein
MRTVAISKATALKLQRLAQRREQARRASSEASSSLREAIIEAREQGATLEEIGGAIGSSKQRIWKFVQSQ